MNLESRVFARSVRLAFLILIYGVVASLSFYLSYELRFDFNVPYEHVVGRNILIYFAVILRILFLVLFRQTGIMLTFFSIPDLIRLGWAVVLGSVVMLVPRYFDTTVAVVPRGVLLIDLMLCSALLCGFRLSIRLYRERISDKSENTGKKLEKVIVVGAGGAGASLAKELMSRPNRGLKPVLFFDDNNNKHGKFIHGLLIVGKPEEIINTKAANGVRRVIIAMPSAAQKRIREIVVMLTGQGYKVEIMPALDDIASGRVRVTKVRPVDIEDLLGREEVELDKGSIRKFIENKVVVVTGAGGSIGSELCRQIANNNPKRLLMIEQSEVSLFQIEQEMNERGMGGICEPLVADIIDKPRLRYLFERYKPQAIFHAAAHKHVFLMERQPMEAIRNNSIGTYALAQLASECGVEKFVLISTDKAINPTNVMGASKRLAEMLLQSLQARVNSERKGHQIQFMAVRFGNVLGSSGSVVPIFKKQIEAGGPVTVTHPEVTRYFMTIPEAVGLVMQAAVLGDKEESRDEFSIFVLDMGSPVKIVDLARQMIELSGFVVGEDIEIKFVGLKPGEKLYEELKHSSENYVKTEHPRIMRFVTNSLNKEMCERVRVELEERLYKIDNNQAKRTLHDIIPEYTPHWE